MRAWLYYSIARRDSYELHDRDENIRLFRRNHVDGDARLAFRLLKIPNDFNHLVSVRLKGNGFVREST